MAEQNQPKQPKKKRLLLGITIALGCVLVAGIVCLALMWNYVANPQNAFSELGQGNQLAASAPTPTPPPAATPTEALPSESPSLQATATPSAEPTPIPPELEFQKQRVNILVLGADSSVERVDAGMNFRTDTMILVSVDFTEKKIDMISIPRDSYARINGGNSFNKINAAFTYGGGSDENGYDYSMNTVSQLFGVPVDYYVGFGMNVVKEIVDAIGGVDYDVDIAFTMNGRRMEKGQQHLDGQQVLDYCRFRKDSKGDLGRVDRQQRMLLAMFNQMLDAKQIMNVPKIYESVEENLDTNLDLGQIATMAYFAKDLSMSDIQKHTLPGYGSYVGSRSYYIINQDEKNQLVMELFNVEGPFDEGITRAAIEERQGGWSGDWTDEGFGSVG